MEAKCSAIDSTNHYAEAKCSANDSTNHCTEVKCSANDSANHCTEAKCSAIDSTNHCTEAKCSAIDSTNHCAETKVQCFASQNTFALWPRTQNLTKTMLPRRVEIQNFFLPLPPIKEDCKNLLRRNPRGCRQRFGYWAMRGLGSFF